MPVAPNPFLVILSLLLLGTAAAMLTALFWLVRRILTGGPLLPSWPKLPRRVPWGAGTVLLVILTWGIVSLSVSSAYFAVTSYFQIQAAAKPPSLKNQPAPKHGPETIGQEKNPVPLLSFTEQMILVSLINGVLIAILPVLLLITSGAVARDVGLVTDHFRRNLTLGVVAFLVVTPLVMGVNAFAQLVWKPNRHPLEKMLREGADPVLIVLAYLAAVVLAPAAEELIFRGVIQGWLRRLVLGDDTSLLEFSADGPPTNQSTAGFRWFPRIPGLRSPRPSVSENPYQEPDSELVGPVDPPLSRENPVLRRAIPVVLTSAFFAAVHYEQMPAPLAIFPLSIALGLLYETTESLLPSFVLHALFNGFNTTLLVGAILVNSGAKP